jgi:hypothetical protein
VASQVGLGRFCEILISKSGFRKIKFHFFVRVDWYIKPELTSLALSENIDGFSFFFIPFLSQKVPFLLQLP